MEPIKQFEKEVEEGITIAFLRLTNKLNRIRGF